MYTSHQSLYHEVKHLSQLTKEFCLTFRFVLARKVVIGIHASESFSFLCYPDSPSSTGYPGCSVTEERETTR